MKGGRAGVGGPTGADWGGDRDGRADRGTGVVGAGGRTTGRTTGRAVGTSPLTICPMKRCPRRRRRHPPSPEGFRGRLHDRIAGARHGHLWAVTDQSDDG